MKFIHPYEKADVFELDGETTLIALKTKELRGRENVFLEEIMANNTKKAMIVDLSSLTFIDSGSIGLLISMERKAAAEGRYVGVCKAQGTVMNVLRMVGAASIFPAYNWGIDEAHQEYKAKNQ